MRWDFLETFGNRYLGHLLFINWNLECFPDSFYFFFERAKNPSLQLFKVKPYGDQEKEICSHVANVSSGFLALTLLAALRYLHSNYHCQDSTLALYTSRAQSQ